MKPTLQQKLVDWESAFNSINNPQHKDAKILYGLILELRNSGVSVA